MTVRIQRTRLVSTPNSRPAPSASKCPSSASMKRSALKTGDAIKLCPKARQCKSNGLLSRHRFGCDHAVPHGEESNCDMPDGSHCPTCAEQTFVVVKDERCLDG